MVTKLHGNTFELIRQKEDLVKGSTQNGSNGFCCFDSHCKANTHINNHSHSFIRLRNPPFPLGLPSAFHYFVIMIMVMTNIFIKIIIPVTIMLVIISVMRMTIIIMIMITIMKIVVLIMVSIVMTMMKVIMVMIA